MQEQEGDLVIDLSGQGGGSLRLHDINEGDIMADHFVFFQDDSGAIAAA